MRQALAVLLDKARAAWLLADPEQVPLPVVDYQAMNGCSTTCCANSVQAPTIGSASTAAKAELTTWWFATTCAAHC